MTRLTILFSNVIGENMINVGDCKHCGEMMNSDNTTSTIRWMDSDIMDHERISVHQSCLKFVDRWADHIKK